MTDAWHRVAAAEDVPEGRMKGVVVDGRDIVIRDLERLIRHEM